jgi:hypothetical protein
MAVRYRVSGRVPDVSLPRAGGGPPTPIRGRPREGVVLLFPRPDPGWHDYLRAVAHEAPAFADWDGRIIAVTPDQHTSWQELAHELGEAIWMVDDPDDVLAPGPPLQAAAVLPDTPPTGGPPMAVVADRFGEIYHVWENENGEAGRPTPRQLEEWLQFLALQCPE